MKRVRFTPARRLTRFGFQRPVWFGCDEHHNRTLVVTVPLIGSWCLWLANDETSHPGSGFTLGGVLHLDVEPVPGCPGCDEFLADWIGWDGETIVMFDPTEDEPDGGVDLDAVLRSIDR